MALTWARSRVCSITISPGGRGRRTFLWIILNASRQAACTSFLWHREKLLRRLLVNHRNSAGGTCTSGGENHLVGSAGLIINFGFLVTVELENAGGELDTITACDAARLVDGGFKFCHLILTL